MIAKIESKSWCGSYAVASSRFGPEVVGAKSLNTAALKVRSERDASVDLAYPQHMSYSSAPTSQLSHNRVAAHINQVARSQRSYLYREWYLWVSAVTILPSSLVWLLQGKLPEWMHTPVGVALPFGTFDAVLQDEVNADVSADFVTAAGFDGTADANLSNLENIRAIIQRLKAPDSLRQQLRDAFHEEGVLLLNKSPFYSRYSDQRQSAPASSCALCSPPHGQPFPANLMKLHNVPHRAGVGGRPVGGFLGRNKEGLGVQVERAGGAQPAPGRAGAQSAADGCAVPGGSTGALCLCGAHH